MWWDSLSRTDADKLNTNSLRRKTRNGDFRKRQQSAGSKPSGNARIANGSSSARCENVPYPAHGMREILREQISDAMARMAGIRHAVN